MVNQLPQGWKEEELGKHANIKRGDFCFVGLYR